MSRSWVYKLHFVPVYKHAAHYSGRSRQPRHRLDDHALGRGARLPQVQVQAGGSWVIGLMEPGGTERERQIKGHDAARHCGVCKAEKAYAAGEKTAAEALTTAGWNEATPHQRGLLLEVFGLDAAPEDVAPVSDPVPPKPVFGVPPPREPAEPEMTAEDLACMERLEAGWLAEKQAAEEAGREMEMEAG
jgi:hypothetical protein